MPVEVLAPVAAIGKRNHKGFKPPFFHGRGMPLLCQQMQNRNQSGAFVAVVKGMVLNQPKERGCRYVKIRRPFADSAETDKLA
ncbi:MAG: hypothetical protein OD817_00160 [Gammaproteobacteria bacterium]